MKTLILIVAIFLLLINMDILGRAAEAKAPCLR